MKNFLTILLVITFLTSPCFAFTNTDLDISITPIALSSQLKKYYNGYEYKLTNVSKSSINIINAQIVNGNNGNIAFTNAMNNEPSAMARTWIIAGPVGLFTLGLGWVAGLVATPIVAIISDKEKRSAKTESVVYTNMLNLGHLNAGESTSVSTLVPIGSKPQLKLSVQDNKNQAHIVSY